MGEGIDALAGPKTFVLHRVLCSIGLYVFPDSLLQNKSLLFLPSCFLPKTKEFY